MPEEKIERPKIAFDHLYLKVIWHILPLIVLCYVVSYIDRVNVSFAKLEMSADLNISAAAYGFGAGIFFLGYFLFELPSNLIMHRVGARVWIARIMISWGVISAAMAFIAPIAGFFGISTSVSFYILRFLLGVAEAGFFPGLILYFNYWFTSETHGRIMALLLIAQPVSFILGSPLSGGLMQLFAQSPHMHSWQWMFLIEGLPAVLLGFLIILYLNNGIDDAKWLSSEEKSELKRRLENDNASKQDYPFGELFKQPILWALTLIYFLLVVGIYGINFWLPSLIKATGVTSLFSIGLVTAIPYLIGVVGMILATRKAEHSNRRKEFATFAAFVGGLGLIISAVFQDNLVLTTLGIALAVGGSMTVNALFWSFPGAIMKGAAIAAGIAAINSVGNLGGFAGPYILGFLSDTLGTAQYGLIILGLCMATSGLLIAWKCANLRQAEQ